MQRAELALRRAHTLVGLGELRTAADELQAIIGESEALERDDLRCDGLIALGNVAGRQGRPAEASRLLQTAEELAARLEDPRLDDPGRLRVRLVGGVFRR